MSETFDPYRQWLGREAGPPRDHYELLGIRRDETDLAAIARQADGLTARIRRIRPGPHVSAWQDLLDAVAAAKRCLTDPEARAAYDASLLQGGASAGDRLSAPAGSSSLRWETPEMTGPAIAWAAERTAALAPAAAVPWDQEGRAQVPQGRHSAAAATPAAWWLLRVLGIVVLLLGAVLGAWEWQRYRQGRWASLASVFGNLPQPGGVAGDPQSAPAVFGNASHKQAKSSPTASAQGRPQPLAPQQPAFEPALQPGAGSAVAMAPPRDGDSAQSKAGRGGSYTRPPGPADSEKTAPKQPADTSPDPQKAQALRSAFSQARGAMARRDLASARKHLQAAAQHIQGPDDEAQVARLENLLANLEEFWKGMQQVLATLQPAQELMIGSTPMIVVSADARELTYRSEGANRTVSLQDMPGALVLALAEAGFAKHPSQKVLIAAFLLADAQGDPRRARRLLEEAAQGGENVEALLAELNQRGPATADQLPPPDAARLQQARQAARERFGAEFRSATRAPARLALSQKLRDAAGDATLAADLRYALLAEAADLAAAAGKAGAACETIDQLAAVFRVDAVALKMATLERTAKSVLGIHSQKEFVEVALKTASQAIEAQRREEAQKLADLALAVARRSRSPALLRAVQAGREQLGLPGRQW